MVQGLTSRANLGGMDILTGVSAAVTGLDHRLGHKVELVEGLFSISKSHGSAYRGLLYGPTRTTIGGAEPWIRMLLSVPVA